MKFGNAKSLKLLNCGANDFMGTILSEEITKRAGGGYGEYRSFDDYVEMMVSESAVRRLEAGKSAVENGTATRSEDAVGGRHYHNRYIPVDSHRKSIPSSGLTRYH